MDISGFKLDKKTVVFNFLNSPTTVIVHRV